MKLFPELIPLRISTPHGSSAASTLIARKNAASNSETCRQRLLVQQTIRMLLVYKITCYGLHFRVQWVIFRAPDLQPEPFLSAHSLFPECIMRKSEADYLLCFLQTKNIPACPDTSLRETTIIQQGGCRGGVFLCVKNQQQHMWLWDSVCATKVCHLTLPVDSMSGYYQLHLSIITNVTHPRSIFRLAARKCWFCSSMQKSTWLYRRRLARIWKVYLKVLSLRGFHRVPIANRNTTIVNTGVLSAVQNFLNQFLV